MHTRTRAHTYTHTHTHTHTRARAYYILKYNIFSAYLSYVTFIKKINIMAYNKNLAPVLLILNMNSLKKN